MVVVFGSINADLVANVAVLPREGETRTASGYAVHAGGKGANQALAARRAGARVTLVGVVGRDGFAEIALGTLRDAGVDLSGVAISNRPTGVALIHVDAQGRNTITVVSGANAEARADAVADVALGPATTLLLQLEVPATEVLALAGRAHDRGSRVILNVAPPAPLPDHAFDLVFGLSVMTHLDAPVRAAWLVELARVTAPGGLALLTVLGPTGAASEPLTADEAATYARDGHCFKRLEHTIGAAVGEPTYYGNAFVTHAHLRATWSAAFDVVAIVPAEVGFRQDVVVLRKRADGS